MTSNSLRFKKKKNIKIGTPNKMLLGNRQDKIQSNLETSFFEVV